MNKNIIRQFFVFSALSMFFLGLYLFSFGAGSIASQVYRGRIDTAKIVNEIQSIDRGSLPRAFVIESGSMEPAIPTASVILSMPSPNYNKGDIISFNSSGSRVVTHRIVRKDIREGVAYYATKGDANEDPDSAIVSGDQVIGRVTISVPELGRAVNTAKTPKGFIFLVIVPATIIVYEELRSLKKELGKLLKRFKKSATAASHEHKSKTLPKAAVAVPILGSLFLLIGVTGAYFFDLETIAGNTFAVYTPAPTQEPEVLPANTEILPTPEPTLQPNTTATPSPTATPISTTTPVPTQTIEP